MLLDNLSNSDISVLDRLAKVIGRRLPFVEGDVCHEKIVEDTLISFGIDSVIHFAGLKSVGESVAEPLKYFINNVSGTLSLLNVIRRTPVKSFVFSSSATVYGVPKSLPLNEEHPREATNPYGRSKLIVEHILEDIAEVDPSLHIACLRYFNPVGAHPSGYIGESPKGKPSNLMPFIAQVAEGYHEFVSVFGDDYDTRDGSGIRDYIHVMDLVEGHVSALDYLNTHSGFHAFNLGSGRGFSVFEMISAYESVCGKNIPYKIVNRRSGDVASCYANADRARDLLKWSTHRSLQDMCLSVFRYQKKLK